MSYVFEVFMVSGWGSWKLLWMYTLCTCVTSAGAQLVSLNLKLLGKNLMKLTVFRISWIMGFWAAQPEAQGLIMYMGFPGYQGHGLDAWEQNFLYKDLELQESLFMRLRIVNINSISRILDRQVVGPADPRLWIRRP